MEQRQAARLILLDPENRILLLRYAPKDVVFWTTPGGGLEPGETFEQAIVREGREELGITAVPVKFLWERMTDLIYVDSPVRQLERYYQVEGGLPDITASMQEFHQEEGILELRWWSLAELEATRDTVFPEELVSKLKEIIGVD